MQKYIQHNKDERTQFFRKIYLSLNLKGSERVTKYIICERWVGDWIKLQHIDHHSSGHSSISFSLSWAAQPVALEPSLCWDMVLIPASSIQPSWSSCRWGYIIIWHLPTSCERHNSHTIQHFDRQGRHPSTGCTCYLHRCISSFDSLAGVNMLQLFNGLSTVLCYLMPNPPF